MPLCPCGQTAAKNPKEKPLHGNEDERIEQRPYGRMEEELHHALGHIARQATSFGQPAEEVGTVAQE